MRVDNNRIAINDFLKECKEDISSPTTSTFTTKLSLCRATIAALEESLDADRSSLKKLKNATKAMYNSGQTHANSELSFVDNLEKLGNNEWSKSYQDKDLDIGNAFLRLSCFMRSIYDLYHKLVSGMNKSIMFPLESLLKGDLKGVKGELKRPFDKSWKDYDTKVKHVEREKRQLAKEAGMIRGEISGSEIAEEMERERRMFQLQMCEYLIKANDIKTKKEVELLQHLVDFYECQNMYFTEGVKVINQFRAYTDKLTTNLKTLRQTHDEEKKELHEVRSLLRASFNEKDDGPSKASPTVYNLHQMEGNRKLGNEKQGYLSKKSEGLRKTWQKRKCTVKDGYLEMSHRDLSSKPPVKLNLLTSQLKLVSEDKKQFDLVSHNRTYRFMAESDLEAENWVSVLQNSKLDALNQVFVGGSGKQDDNNDSGLKDLTRAIIEEIKRLPGNDRCCDCNNESPTWLSTNLGVLLCIECSGIHREMGVHVSRIQSITLDELGTSELLLARTIGNFSFNDVMEEQLLTNFKPTTASDMEERKSFIRGKYIDRKYVVRTCGHNSRTLADDLGQAVRSCDLASLLQIYAEQADLADPLPGYKKNETALHIASSMPATQGLSSVLPLVDFLSQNVGAQGLNRQTDEGDTALHICALHNNTECMKLLLRSKAKTDVENYAGESSMDVAVRLNHQNCVELLNQSNSSKFRALIYIDIEWNLTYTDDDNDFISDDELEDKNVPLQPPAPIPGHGSKHHLDVTSSQSMKERSKSSDPPPSLPPRNPPPVPAHGSRVRSQTANTNIGFAPWSGLPSVVQRKPPSSEHNASDKSSVGKSPSTRSVHPALENHSFGGRAGSTKLPPQPDKPTSFLHGRHAGSMMIRSTDKSKRAAPASVVSTKQQQQVTGISPDVRLRMKPAASASGSPSNRHRSPELRRLSNGPAGGALTPPRQQSPNTRCKSLLETPSDSRVKRLSARFSASVSGIPEGNSGGGVVAGGNVTSSPHSNPPLMRSASRPPSLSHQRQNSQPAAMLGLLNSTPPSSLSLPRNVKPPDPRREELPPKPAPSHLYRMKTPPTSKRPKRVRAMYDCDADNDDELTFVEGEVIIITGEEDGEWWIGHVEHQLHRSGVFPIKFVEIINE